MSVMKLWHLIMKGNRGSNSLKKIMCVKSPSLSHSHHFFFSFWIYAEKHSTCYLSAVQLLCTKHLNQRPVLEIEQ